MAKKKQEDTPERVDLTAEQTDENGLSRWAVFLPALSGFYAIYIGSQRAKNYVDPSRFPAGLNGMEELNWLNPKAGLFKYRWSLYSGGHANLDLTKPDIKENMVRERDPSTLIVGDSGGFQIGKGHWAGEWKAPNSQRVADTMAKMVQRGFEDRPVLDKSGNPVLDKNGQPKISRVNLVKEYQGKLDMVQERREAVLKWLDGITNYAMILDVPAWVRKRPHARKATGIETYEDAVEATKFNNEYFIKNRKGVNNGGTRFLNVLQGSNHTEADDWYETMKQYCDPSVYPDRQFDGWAFGGQNTSDMHLILKRLVSLRYDNLLQEGKHDWIHILGTSKLEWAVMFTVLQTALRKYVNPKVTISFDCASPFLAAANGQVYHHIDVQPGKKWSYRMSPSIDDKKYATDTRLFSDVAMTDYRSHFKHFDESPVSALCQVKDICYYKKGDLNKIGKEGRTSWDSFSYTLQMGHNVWTHIYAVQEANRQFEKGVYAPMMENKTGDFAHFHDVVERIFAAPTREAAEEIIDGYSQFWMHVPGTHGNKGKKSMNCLTMYNSLFEEEDNDGFADDEIEFDEEVLDKLESDIKGE
jgi:hypothetical protein